MSSSLSVKKSGTEASHGRRHQSGDVGVMQSIASAPVPGQPGSIALRGGKPAVTQADKQISNAILVEMAALRPPIRTAYLPK